MTKNTEIKLDNVNPIEQEMIENDEEKQPEEKAKKQKVKEKQELVPKKAIFLEHCGLVLPENDGTYVYMSFSKHQEIRDPRVLLKLTKIDNSDNPKFVFE